MKTIRPRFVKSHGLGPGCSIADHYRANCPFCRERNLAWPSEMEKGADGGTNRCAHFEAIRAGRFVFRKTPSIRVSRAGIAINGVLFETPHLGNVVALFDEIRDEEYPHHEGMARLGLFSSSYAFGTRTNAKFKLIHKALEKRWRASSRVNA